MTLLTCNEMCLLALMGKNKISKIYPVCRIMINVPTAGRPGVPKEMNLLLETNACAKSMCVNTKKM